MLQIYNTLTRQKQPFVPLEAGKIGIYVCGVTTYDYCHIGHARVMVCFDAIVRYLRARGFAVTYVRNITDIDDKIIRRALENQEDYRDLTARFIDYMHADERALNVLPPDIEPRATEHIAEIIAMTAKLIERGYAYNVDGDVYFAIAQFPEYGALANKKLDELLEGVRVQVQDGKKDPRDFALWKSAKPDEIGWQSPFGYGRPGWHIECSAMSTKWLGAHFDIHGGGPDLVFPHHENEIAQSTCATGQKYANYWLHAGAVLVDKQKMSKSLFNFVTIRDVLAQYHPEVVRMLLLSSHYRSAINYSADSLEGARKALERLYAALEGAVDNISPQALQATPAYHKFCQAMDDDFNTAEAMAVLFELARDANNQVAGAKAQLLALGNLLGLLGEDATLFLQSGGRAGAQQISDAAIDQLVKERDLAKQNKDYPRADEIRSKLAALGVSLLDSPSGSTWRRQ